MTRLKTTFIVSVIFLVLCTQLSFSGSIEEQENSELVDVEITMMLDWTPNTNHTGIYVALVQGWYDDLGLSVDIVEPTSGGVPQAVATGRAQFGISVQEEVIPAREQGIPIVSIAAIIKNNTTSLITLDEEKVNRPRDLEDKTYGGYGGALERALISTLVECDGGNSSKVKFVEVGNVDYLVGMKQNYYDFVWIFDGWDGIRYNNLVDSDISYLHFIDYVDCIPDWYTPVIISSEELIANNPDVVHDFMNATARGYRFAIEKPLAAAQILLEKVPELDSDLTQNSAMYLAKHYTNNTSKWGYQEMEVWTRFESFLRKSGLTNNQIDVSRAYSNEFLPKE